MKIMDIYLFTSSFSQKWGWGGPMGLGSVCLEKEESMVRVGAQGGEIQLLIPEGFLQLFPLCPQNGHMKVIWACAEAFSDFSDIHQCPGVGGLGNAPLTKPWLICRKDWG